MQLPTMPRRNNAPAVIAPPTVSTICTNALATSRSIDNLVLNHLQRVSSRPNRASPSLAKHLSGLHAGEISRRVTPQIPWGGDPSWPKAEYGSCLVHATLVGRPFALSHLRSPEGFALYPTSELYETRTFGLS